MSSNASEEHRGVIVKTTYLRPITLLCVFLLTLYPSRLIILSYESDSTAIRTKSCIFILSEYDPYSPFQITSNQDFSDKAGSFGWDGDGSVGDPYIISKINVTLETGIAPLIKITDTNVHFIINSSLFVGGLNSIHFENVTNGIVSNNSIYHADMQGVYLRNVTDCRFDNNFITENGYMGLLADYTENCTFLNNLIEDNSNSGTKLRDSPNNLVKNNTFAKNREDGLALGNSPNCDVVGNIIHGNWGTGISVEVSTPLEIINNSIYENSEVGVNLVGYEPKSNVTGNTFYNNDEHALVLMAPETMVFRNNFIHDDIASPGVSHISDISEFGIYSENFWSDWVYPDENHDNVVDLPYHIHGVLVDETPRVNVHLDHKIHILTKPNPIFPNDRMDAKYFIGLLDVNWSQSSDTFGHTVTYSLDYSTNETTIWSRIISGVTNTEYQLDTDTLPENKIFYLRVIAACQDTTSVSCFTSNYTKRVHSLSVPTILRPVDGEVIQEPFDITWSESIDTWFDAKNPWEHSVWYNIYFSQDGGFEWITLESGQQNTHLSWYTNSSWNGEYMVKVIAAAPCGLMSEDVTGSFNVSYVPEATTTSDDLIPIFALGIASIVGIMALVIVLKRKGSP